MRSTAATVGADRRGCFSVAPSVARTRRAGCKSAEGRPCSAGVQGGAGASSSRRWTASGDFIGRGVRGARNLRRRPALWGSRCAVSGDFIGRCGARCAELTPTACALSRRCAASVRGCAVSGDFIGRGCRGARDSRRLPARRCSRCGGFGAGGCAVSGDFIGRCGARCAELMPTACAVAFTVRRGLAKRAPFRFPRSVRAATAVPRPRRHRPVHGLGRGAPHRPRGCSTVLPGC